MSDEELKAELERLRNENAVLKKGASSNIRMKVSQKGAVSIYAELFTWHTHNRLIQLAFFFARAVGYWTRGSGTPSRAKACSCRAVGRASIWIVRRSPSGSATSLIVSVPS